MSYDTPQFRQAMEEADFLRERLLKTHAKLEKEPQHLEVYCDYLHTMYALIDKEHSIYTRLKLIDSEESRAAIEMLDAHKIAGMLLDDSISIHNIYPKVKEELIDLIKEVSGDDFDPEDFSLE